MITAILLFSLAQSGRQRAVSPPIHAVTDWKIEIATDGGFAGSGNGGLTGSSDGVLVITPGPGSPKRCTFQLTASELQALNAAVNSARPAAWAECYSLADVSTHCCDLIRTTFSLTERGGRDQFVTSWLTGSQPLPNDLENIVDLLRGPAGLDARYRQLCATTP